MTELKTLKDLAFSLEWDEEGVNDKIIKLGDLRAEAVKWVKFDSEILRRKPDYYFFAKQFFNLTEDDLK